LGEKRVYTAYTPAVNQVAFNGVAATVVSATATRLEVDVPAGASTGPLTVTVGGSTVTADTDFQVQAIPVITGLSTRFVLAGTPVQGKPGVTRKARGQVSPDIGN